MGNSSTKDGEIGRAVHHHFDHRAQCNVAPCFECIDARRRIQEINEPPPTYDVSVNQRNYPSAPPFPTNNYGSNTLYPNLDDSNIRNSNPVIANVPQNAMGFEIPLDRRLFNEESNVANQMVVIQYLLKLSTEGEDLDVANQMLFHKNLFVKLFKKPLEHSLMLILMKLVKKICFCKSTHVLEKIEILEFVCTKNFFLCLGDYISNLPTHGQDTAQEDRLFLVETVVPFLATVFILSWKDIRIELRYLAIKTSLSIQGMEQYRGMEISDDSKQCVQTISSVLQGDDLKTDPKRCIQIIVGDLNCDVKIDPKKCIQIIVADLNCDVKIDPKAYVRTIASVLQCDVKIDPKKCVQIILSILQRHFKTDLLSSKEGKERKDSQQDGVPLDGQLIKKGILTKNRVPSNDPVKHVFQFPSENKIMTSQTEGNVREDSQQEKEPLEGQSRFQGVLKKKRAPYCRIIREDSQQEKVSQKGNKNISLAQFDELIPSKTPENYSYELRAMSAFKSKKVRGMQKSFFFIDKVFKKENYNSEFLIALAQYLTKQQYDAKNILLLSTDEDDLQNTLRVKKKHTSLENISSKLLSDTGSWSCSIVLISFSLKSSGTTKCILDNHIIRKAVLEAKEGIFMIGSMPNLQKLNTFWSTLNAFLQDNESISPRITLCCQTHGAISIVNEVQDFNTHRNGGCNKDCDMKLDCGHFCVRQCHTDDINHKEYFCHKPCTRKPENCSRNHSCRKFCFEICGSCPVIVNLFGQNIMCHILPQTNTNVHGEYPNTHNEDIQSTKSAGTDLNISSHPLNTHKSQKDNRLLPCGHTANITFLPRFRKLNQWSSELVNLCNEPCSATLECGHSCTGTCGECRQGRVHISCRNTRKIKLACGHRLVVGCRVNTANCNQKCFYQCSHSSCRNKCGESCTPCDEPCVRGCEHGRCTKRCSERCNWQPCCKPCQKFLSCGHKCIGFCGEPCPAGPHNCRQCNAERFKKCDSSGKARFVVLEDCNHVVKAFNLDQRMFAKHRKLEVLYCPICGYSILKTDRYLNYNREVFRALFLIKCKSNEYCKEVSGKFWNIVEEIKQYSVPQEIEVSPPLQQLKEYTGIAASSGLIDEKSLILLQFYRNALCSLGTAPYRPLLWLLTLFLEHYENGFSNQVLKELYGLVVKHQTLNGNLNRQNLLNLHLALSYFHSLERDTWVLCHKGHVSTSGSLITLCSLCD